MPNNEKTNPKAGVPLARVIRFRELRGLIGKRLDVPAGRMGVAIFSNGKVRTFGAGSHRVLTIPERLLGKGIGLRVGFIPTGELSARANLEYLLSGDGVLLDGSLICSVGIEDPGRFFVDVVMPQSEIWLRQIELDPEVIRAALGSITTQYAAADLVRGTLDTRLIGTIESGADAVLKNQGMHLDQIRMLILSKSENRAVIAEKSQALQERLQDVEVRAAMAKIESQTQLDDFLQQVAPDLKGVAHFHLGENEKTNIKGAAPWSIADEVGGWFRSRSGKDETKRKWSLERLFHPKEETAQEPSWRTVRHPPRHWWVRRVVWMAFAVLVGWILTVLVDNNLREASLAERIRLHVAIWGTVVTLVLASLRVLYQRREAMSEASRLLAPHPHLDHLVRNNRPRADKLVRDECTRELVHIREVISDVRGREYKRAKTDLALKLRNGVERNIEDCAGKIGDANYGPAPYLTDLRISDDAWGRMLDYDEELLLYIQALSDQAQLLQQKSHADQLTDDLVSNLDAGLLKFCNRFYERGRILTPPPEDNKN